MPAPTISTVSGPLGGGPDGGGIPINWRFSRNFGPAGKRYYELFSKIIATSWEVERSGGVGLTADRILPYIQYKFSLLLLTGPLALGRPKKY